MCTSCKGACGEGEEANDEWPGELSYEPSEGSNEGSVGTDPGESGWLPSSELAPGEAGDSNAPGEAGEQTIDEGESGSEACASAAAKAASADGEGGDKTDMCTCRLEVSSVNAPLSVSGLPTRSLDA